MTIEGNMLTEDQLKALLQQDNCNETLKSDCLERSDANRATLLHWAITRRAMNCCLHLLPLISQKMLWTIILDKSDVQEEKCILARRLVTELPKLSIIKQLVEKGIDLNIFQFNNEYSLAALFWQQVSHDDAKEILQDSTTHSYFNFNNAITLRGSCFYNLTSFIALFLPDKLDMLLESINPDGSFRCDLNTSLTYAEV